MTALFLLLAVVVYRVGAGFASPDLSTQLSGYAPFAAMVLGSAVLFSSARLAWLPAAAFLVSDLILNLLVYRVGAFHPAILVSVVFYSLLFLGGRPLARRSSLVVPFLGATVASVLAFHLVSNSIAWAMDPLYARTVSGFIQAHTTGLPGYIPTWMFLVKGLAGNLAFAGLFLLALAPARATTPASAAARA